MKNQKRNKLEPLKINTALQIGKPTSEIYEAIINPEHMCHYFISESSGNLAEAKKITWKFPEFKEAFQIEVIQLIPNELIIFEWPGMQEQLLQVRVSLEPIGDNSSIVRISEGEVKNNKTGLEWLARNTEGWANFLACLKAYLEFGINLRKGGFDFMKTIE